MTKTIRLALTLAALAAFAPVLSACHATAGAGQDISATGSALTGAAKSNTPQ